MAKKSDPRSAQPVFLFGFHRGGSTFMQRLLNCHEDLVVWGEQAGILDDYARMLARFRASAIHKVDVRRYSDFAGFTRDFVPWANPLSGADFRDFIASQIELMYSDRGRIPRWGIKEVQYEGTSTFDFLAEVLPGARFLFLTRDPVAMYASALKARWTNLPREEDVHLHAEEFYRSTRQRLAQMQAFNGSHPEQSMIFAVEDVIAERISWEKLLGFLALEPERFRQDLAEEVRYHRAGSSEGRMGGDVNASYLETALSMLKKTMESDISYSVQINADTSSDVGALQSSLLSCRVELRHAQRQLRLARRMLDRMSQSTSWRITSPLRRLKNLIGRK